MRRLVHWIAYLERPRFFSLFLIRYFVSSQGIDLKEASKPLEGYLSIIDLFTRELKPGSRPIDDGDAVFVSPCDGQVVSFGSIENGMLYQVKDRFYRLSDLIGELSESEMFSYEGGFFLTIYLSPKDYHRTHHPFSANLSQIEYVPGVLLPVNEFSLFHFSEVFSRNRRVIFHYSEAFKMVMVGALNVGDMLVMGQKQLSASGDIPYVEFEDKLVQKGDQAGVFRLGSTVIVLFKKDAVSEAMVSLGQKLKMGQGIIRLK